MKRIFALMLSLLLALGPAVGAADEVDTLAQGILEFKAAQSGAKDVSTWVARDLPGLMGAGGEWYALALGQLGGYDLTACHGAITDYTAATRVRSAATRQKLALSLLATGDPTDFVSATQADSLGQQGVMSGAWGLHLLNNGCVSPAATTEEAVKTLLDLRKPDDGWAVTGERADADVTAMVLQALAPHRDNEEAAAAIESALALLSEMQLPDGGYTSYGVENAESVAQVIVALCALGVDPVSDGRFVKNGATLLDALTAFRLSDGSFCHEKGGAYNENATAQAFMALAAVQVFRERGASLYLLDNAPVPGEMQASPSWKAIAVQVIAGLALAACVALTLLGKRSMKNYLAVAVVAALLAALVGVLEFQSADSYYVAAVEKEGAIGQVTLTVRCDTVAGEAAHIPQSGVLLPETVLPIADGDTVYTVLTDAARLHGLHLDASGAAGMMYLHGIGNIYEFDFGDLSGWVFMVNGASAPMGCSQYVLKDGDVIEWRYTLDLGRDF